MHALTSDFVGCWRWHSSKYAALLKKKEFVAFVLQLLTEFVTREADNSTSKEDQLQQVGDGRVSLSEWVNIVTTDTTCYETLIQVLQNMGSDEREKLLNRFGGSLMQKELENAKIIDERAAIV